MRTNHSPFNGTRRGVFNSSKISQAMMRRRTLFAAGFAGLAGVGVLSGCSASKKEESEDSSKITEGTIEPTVSGAPAVANPSADAFAELTDSLNQIESESGYQLTLSLYQYPTDSFAEGIQYSFKPEYQSYEASLSKVPISLSVLRKLAEENVELDDDTYSLMNASLGYSDNDSTQALFASLGDDPTQQAGYLNTTYANLGITGTHSDGDWGVNLTNAQDQVTIARAVNDGVDWVRAEDLDRMREIMVATDESQTWGVGASAEDMGADYVLCKNGWIQDDATAQWYVNTMGIVNLNGRRYAISALNFGAEPDQQESGYGIATRAVDAALTFFNK